MSSQESTDNLPQVLGLELEPPSLIAVNCSVEVHDPPPCSREVAGQEERFSLRRKIGPHSHPLLRTSQWPSLSAMGGAVFGDRRDKSHSAGTDSHGRALPGSQGDDLGPQRLLEDLHSVGGPPGEGAERDLRVAGAHGSSLLLADAEQDVGVSAGVAEGEVVGRPRRGQDPSQNAKDLGCDRDRLLAGGVRVAAAV